MISRARSENIFLGRATKRHHLLRESLLQEEPSGAAAGWIMFAGVMLIIVGFFQAIAGFVGILEDEFYVATREYVFQFSTTTWGWIHLIIGLILMASGFGVFSGNVLARTVGVLAAIGSMVTAFLWLPRYPIWAIIMISIDVAVIWALAVHGRDLAETS